MTTSPIIRDATSADLPAIEQLLTKSDLPTDGVADVLGDTASHFFVAEAPDARLVAVAGLEHADGDALLRSVAVDPDWRSHGVGRELVRRVVCHAEERGIRALYLLTMTAEHYFPKLGFERIDRGSVPPAIADTLEFKSACPATATAMKRALS